MPAIVTCRIPEAKNIQNLNNIFDQGKFFDLLYPHLDRPSDSE